MQKPAISFLLILLIEAICALVTYLKNKLMRHIYGEGDDFGFDFRSDFADRPMT